MGNYKFGSVKLELGLSGHIDILTLDTYSATLYLSTGKKAQPGDSFQQEITGSQYLISVGKIRRSQTQRERRGNQGFISMGNYKYRSVKFELGL